MTESVSVLCPLSSVYSPKSWQAADAKQGTLGKVLVFPYAAEWEAQFYREKEVTVYYKVIGKAVVLLTVKARYGQSFQKG